MGSNLFYVDRMVLFAEKVITHLEYFITLERTKQRQII